MTARAPTAKPTVVAGKPEEEAGAGGKTYRMRRAPAVLAALLLPLLVTACGGAQRSSALPTTTTATTTTGATTATTTGTTPQPGTQTLRIYLLRGGTVTPVAREVPPTQAVARAALTALVAGPTGSEQADGLSTDVPAEARLRNVTVANGVATVDFDAAFARGAEATIARRLAQVVFTVTQFPSVTSVRFEQDGAPLPTVVDGNGVPLQHPASRADYEAITPPILIESPLPGQTVSSPIDVRGSAIAFEATFQTEVVDASGAVLGKQTVTASEGAPARGSFSVTVPVQAQPGPVRLIAYEDNQATGRRMHVVTVPLQLGP